MTDQDRRPTWLVGIDRPYYPTIDTFHDRAMAEVWYAALLVEHRADAEYESRVYLCEVITTETVRTYH